MKSGWYILLLAICSVLFSSCETEAERVSKERQETAIDNYITTQINADTTRVMVHNDGAYRLIYIAGSGEAATPGDAVEFLYIGYIFLNGKGAAFDTNIDIPGVHPSGNNGKGTIGRGNFIAGLDKGLEGMKPGECAEIIFPSTLGYGNNSVGMVPGLSALLFEIEMINVVKQ